MYENNPNTTSSNSVMVVATSRSEREGQEQLDLVGLYDRLRQGDEMLER